MNYAQAVAELDRLAKVLKAVENASEYLKAAQIAESVVQGLRNEKTKLSQEIEGIEAEKERKLSEASKAIEQMNSQTAIRRADYERTEKDYNKAYREVKARYVQMEKELEENFRAKKTDHERSIAKMAQERASAQDAVKQVQERLAQLRDQLSNVG